MSSACPPNPGSNAARAQGCVCPVLDNNHGTSPPWPPNGWWISEECPIHGAGWKEPSDD